MRSKLADINQPKNTLVGAELGYAEANVSVGLSAGTSVSIITLTCWIPDSTAVIVEYGGGYLCTGTTINSYLFTRFTLDGVERGVGGDTSNPQGLLADSGQVGQFFLNPYKRIRYPASLITPGMHTFGFSCNAGGSAGTAFGGGSGYEKCWLRVSRAS